MGLFGCSHKWEVTGEKYMPADTESEPLSIRNLLLPIRRKKAVTRAFTEITIKCKKCGGTSTCDVTGYKPPQCEE